MSTETTPELLPCPFCGTRDVELRETITDAQVCCNNCGSRTGFVSLGNDKRGNAAQIRMAATLWNSRTRTRTLPMSEVSEAMVEAGAQALFKREMVYVSKHKTMDECRKLGPIYRQKARIILQSALSVSNERAMIERCALVADRYVDRALEASPPSPERAQTAAAIAKDIRAIERGDFIAGGGEANKESEVSEAMVRSAHAAWADLEYARKEHDRTLAVWRSIATRRHKP